MFSKFELFEDLVKVAAVTIEALEFVRADINNDDYLRGWNCKETDDDVISPRQALNTAMRFGHLKYVQWLQSNMLYLENSNLTNNF